MKTKTALALTAVLAVSLAFGAPGASAERLDPPGHRDGNHCVNSFGVDLNDLFGVSDQVVRTGCQEVSAGEHWIPPVFWITSGSDPVYPPGYEPLRPTPSEDFLAKLVAVRVVVDRGTRQERTHTFAPSEVVRTDITAEQMLPGVFPAGAHMVSFLPRMAPVGLGNHTQELIATLSAEHCDGFSTDAANSCIPPGDDSFGARPFTVIKPTG